MKSMTFLMLLTFFLLQSSSIVESSKVLHFSHHSPTGPATLRSVITLPPSFTTCSAVMVDAWTIGSLTETDFVSMFDKRGILEAFFSMLVNADSAEISFKQKKLNFFRARKPAPFVFPLQWVRACLSLDDESKMIKIVVDGILLDDGVHKEMEKENKPGAVNITLGYNKYMTESEKSDMSGKWTNMNIFSASMSEEKMVAMTTPGDDQCGAEGDVISWNEAKWTQETVYIPDRQGPCWKESTMIVYPAGMTFTNCMEHCQKLGAGKAPSVQTEQDWNKIEQELQSINTNVSIIPAMWLAATEGDIDSELKSLPHWAETIDVRETVWRDYYNGAKLDNYTKPWSPGHDDILGSEYNCIAYYPSEARWREFWCPYKHSCICKPSKHVSRLFLRGLCTESLLGTKDMKLGLAYTIKQQSQSAENVFYIGGLSTRISYNSTLEGWIITDAVSNVTAFSKAKEQTYALGKHMWTVNGDNFECFKKHTYTTELKLSGCLEGQFTCNDGQCVQMDERCNQLPNCRDER